MEGSVVGTPFDLVHVFHLQISHLNGKIVEDNEDLIQAKQQTNTVKVTMQTEVHLCSCMCSLFVQLTLLSPRICRVGKS